MRSKIRIGILSSASIAQKSILPTLAELKESYEIVGIASRELSNIETLCKSFHTTAYEGYDALLDEKHIDAVYIPLPNSLHYEYVKKALSRGINVLVEKSLGCNLKEVTELVSLAEKNKLALMENFQFRFHSQLQFLKDTLEKGSLGEIRHLKASFGFPPFADKNNIRYKSELGGGSLLDAGAYTVKISQVILGDDLQVEAAVLNKRAGQEVDIWGGAFLKQKSTGVFSSLAFGFDNHYQCGVEIWGSKGKLTTNRLFTAPKNFKPIFELETSNGKQVIELPEDNHFRNMLLHFKKCVENSDLRIAENKQNLNQSRILEEIKILSNE